MKDQMKKAWKYIKDHKEILIASGVAVIGGICLYKGITYKPSLPMSASKSTFKTDEIKKLIGGAKSSMTKISPEIGVGVVEDAVVYDGGTIELMVDDLKTNDIGKLGEGIVNEISNIPKDAKVWALITIRKED